MDGKIADRKGYEYMKKLVSSTSKTAATSAGSESKASADSRNKSEASLHNHRGSISDAKVWPLIHRAKLHNIASHVIFRLRALSLGRGRQTSSSPPSTWGTKSIELLSEMEAIRNKIIRVIGPVCVWKIIDMNSIHNFCLLSSIACYNNNEQLAQRRTAYYFAMPLLASFRLFPPPSFLIIKY